MTSTDFTALVQSLRELGVRRFRDGDFEIELFETVIESTVVPPKLGFELQPTEKPEPPVRGRDGLLRSEQEELYGRRIDT